MEVSVPFSLFRRCEEQTPLSHAVPAPQAVPVPLISLSIVMFLFISSLVVFTVCVPPKILAITSKVCLLLSCNPKDLKHKDKSV